MGIYSYTGTAAIPHKVGEHIEKRIHVVLQDGKRIPVCDMNLADKYQQHYLKQGIDSTIEVEEVSINDFEIW